jgi:succinoglycan biosynthesis protein ExoU
MNHMHTPTVTHPQVCVIIAAYNASATIARAIVSALAQDEVAEVIVVDDASTDATIEAAQAADDGTNRLKILTQPQNAGPSSARNRAIAASASPWLTVLDADDFYLPGRIKGLLAYAADADFVADNMWQVPESNVNAPRRSLLDHPPETPIAISFTDFVASNVTRPGRPRAELGFIKPLMRRSFMDAHHLRYKEHMRLGEDFELYARALGLGAHMLLVPAQGYVSVVRPDSLSGRHTETDLLHLRDCDHGLLKSLPLNATSRRALRRHYLSLDCRLQWRLLILAVKNRRLGAAIHTFIRPWPVPWYLIKQLGLQCWLRSTKKHIA